MMTSPIINDIGNPKSERKCRKCHETGHRTNSDKCQLKYFIFEEKLLKKLHSYE